MEDLLDLGVAYLELDEMEHWSVHLLAETNDEEEKAEIKLQHKRIQILKAETLQTMAIILQELFGWYVHHLR